MIDRNLITIGIILSVSILICILICSPLYYILNKEITYDDYKSLELLIEADPNIIPFVKKTLDDKKISNREYNYIIRTQYKTNKDNLINKLNNIYNKDN